MWIHLFLPAASACFSTSATKKRMQTVANVSILAMFVMYLLTAIFGYLTFYGNLLWNAGPDQVDGRFLFPDTSLLSSGAVESELLHTYSKVDTLDVLLLCVRLAVLVAVTLTVPVVLFPVRILHAGRGLGWYDYVLFSLSY